MVGSGVASSGARSGTRRISGLWMCILDKRGVFHHILLSGFCQELVDWYDWDAGLEDRLAGDAACVGPLDSLSSHDQACNRSR